MNLPLVAKGRDFRSSRQVLTGDELFIPTWMVSGTISKSRPQSPLGRARCDLQPQFAQLSCNRRIEVLMHCESEKPCDDGYCELLSEDGLDDSRHQEADQDVGNRLCQEARRSHCQFRLIHGHDFIIIGRPLQHN